MLKKLFLACQLLVAAFLVKFFDADSNSDSDSGDCDSGGSDSGDSDSGSTEGSSDISSASVESLDSSGDTNSDSTNSQSSQRKPKIVPNPEDLMNLNPQDLTQIPRRDN